jgi:lambda repressor-like predicted transcriptional regulator
MEYTADLRDDVVSLIRNSGLTLAQIHARCGPTPNTLLNWMDKRTMRPQMGKMQAVLRILGKDLGIVETRRGGDRTNVRRTFRVIK